MTQCVDAERRAADRLLLRTALRGRGWLWTLGAVAALLAAAEAALPALLGRAVDAALGRAPATWIAWASACVIGLALADAADDLAAGRASARATAWLRNTLLRHILDAGITALDRRAPGDMATRVVANASNAGRAGADMVRVAANLAPAITAMVALGVIDPWLLLTVALGAPLLVAALAVFMRDATRLSTAYLAVQGRIADRLSEALAGRRTIASSGTAAREVDRILEPLPRLREHGAAMWRAQGRIAVRETLLVPLLEIAVLGVAGLELAAGRISPGALVAAARYAVLATALLSAGPAAGRLARARAAAGRVQEPLTGPVTHHGDLVLAPGPGRLELRGVRLERGGRTVLDGVDLTIDGGSLVAIVGRSGAGKSLLTAVAGRLADPDAGSVTLDGVPLAAMRRHELRAEIGYAFARPALLGDTVADAIALGVHRPSPDAVVDAARAACADGFLRRLPAGYANRMEATPLSGGEAQRLGLARAFAHPGRLLILDDVAANLDSVTDHRITGVLTGPLGGRTRIVVAHRASTAARADVVVWLEGGRVRAVAPHAELWSDAAYRALFDPERDSDGEPSTNGRLVRAPDGGPAAVRTGVAPR